MYQPCKKEVKPGLLSWWCCTWWQW